MNKKNNHMFLIREGKSADALASWNRQLGRNNNTTNKTPSFAVTYTKKQKDLKHGSHFVSVGSWGF